MRNQYLQKPQKIRLIAMPCLFKDRAHVPALGRAQQLPESQFYGERLGEQCYWAFHTTVGVTFKVALFWLKTKI
jgi:hypothetical protein